MKNRMNYRISVPVMLHDRFCKEEVLDALRQCQAQRVFLAVDVISFDRAKHEKMMEMLAEYVPYLKASGLEVGIWFWGFWRTGMTPEQIDEYLMVDLEGKKRVSGENLSSGIRMDAGYCCPASAGFRASAMAVVEAFALLHPDILMLDDDYRFGFLGPSMGCFCDSHMRLYEKRIGRRVSRRELAEAVYAEKPNVLREAVLEVLGESLEEFARQMRETVDRVDPGIRIALCSVMSLWDTDGTDCITLAKLLAGRTKPLLRLCGAPYWAVTKAWGNRLQHTIELERMEEAWCDGEELEIMTEGDVYPRPRHNVPASFLEGFDTALRAAGTGDGILKYMLDYTSSMGYETGYRKRHMEHAGLYRRIEEFFGGKQETGVRVYETRNKFRDSSLQGVSDVREYVQNQFFSVAARVLADNTVPAIYRGNNGAGIAFGENARHLPPEALENGLILDIRGAGILMEMGIDVGIASIGERLEIGQLCYPGYAGGKEEYVSCGCTLGMICRLGLKEGAEVVTYAVRGEECWPEAFHYQNQSGQKFLVYAFDGAVVCEEQYRSYCRQSQLYASIRWMAEASLPAACRGNPDLYILCKRSETEMAIGLWNFFPDSIPEPVVELDQEYAEAEFACCTGVLEGRLLKLSALQPYACALIRLAK